MKWIRILLLSIGCLLFVDTVGSAQVPRRSSVNLQHPLAQKLLTWLTVRSPLTAGPIWWATVGSYHGSLVSMGAGFGWQASGYPGYVGEMRFDGSTTAVSLGTSNALAFNNRTVAFAVRWRVTGSTGGSQYLVGHRFSTDTPEGGGYFIRVTTSGTLHARILSPAGIVAERETVSTTAADGLWHSGVVIFTFDTAVPGSNNITIYYDGALDGTISGSTNAYSSCTSCGLNLGSPSDIGAANLLGSIVDFRIYDGALSPVQVKAFHRDRGPSFGGLIINDFLGLAQAAARARRKVIWE